MKKSSHIALCILFLLFTRLAFSQETGSLLNRIAINDTTKYSQSKALIKTANNLKSGNWQDVLSNFFQVATNDITGNNHTLAFKTNLFALKAKADASLLIDKNYVKQKFARNFQFNFNLKLDSNYRFNGFKGGFTWAIVNKRDSSVVQFIVPYTKQFNRLLSIELSNLQDSLTFSSGNAIGQFLNKDDSLYYLKVKDSVDDLLAKDIISESLLPHVFKQRDVLISLFNQADSAFKDSLAKVAKQPLVTFSANGNFNKQDSKLNGGDAAFVWLQGFTSQAYKTGNGSSCESDFRVTGILIDTTINNLNIRRSFTDATWGLNIMSIRNYKSVVELKPYLEYKHIFKGTIAGEKKDDFYADADLRIRITENLWLPLTVKYDIKKGNVLGFLNVAFNMNAFKSSN